MPDTVLHPHFGDYHHPPVAGEPVGASQATLERIGRELLIAIGEDPDREGLRDTPRRFAKAWLEFIAPPPSNVDTAFSHSETDQMVVVSGVEAWTMCEHHLLPFIVNVSIGYLTEGSVLGLSKLARIVQYYAHQLQLQEQLTQQVADHVKRAAKTASVAVLVSGHHLCMMMRGVRSNAAMHTSVMRGEFLKPEVKAEFLAMLQAQSVSSGRPF